MPVTVVPISDKNKTTMSIKAIILPLFFIHLILSVCKFNLKFIADSLPPVSRTLTHHHFVGSVMQHNPYTYEFVIGKLIELLHKDAVLDCFSTHNLANNPKFPP